MTGVRVPATDPTTGCRVPARTIAGDVADLAFTRRTAKASRHVAARGPRNPSSSETCPARPQMDPWCCSSSANSWISTSSRGVPRGSAVDIIQGPRWRVAALGRSVRRTTADVADLAFTRACPWLDRGAGTAARGPRRRCPARARPGRDRRKCAGAKSTMAPTGYRPFAGQPFGGRVCPPAGRPWLKQWNCSLNGRPDQLSRVS
jgi:hypothetical protein